MWIFTEKITDLVDKKAGKEHRSKTKTTGFNWKNNKRYAIYLYE